MLIVVTIPAFNEQETIGVMVDQINQVMLSVSYSYKILVLDDGSSDNTAKVARKSGAIVHSHPKNYGLADTFKTEVKKSLELGADIIIHIDADNQYLPKEIPLLIKEVENGADLVLGSRFKGKIESMPWIKKVGNIAFSKVISMITGTDISDAQTGFRAFTKSVAEDINIISDHTYTQEQIIKAVRNKFKIVEVPVSFAKRKDKSRLIGNSIGYAIRAWINIIRIYRDYEPLKFFGVVGSLIFSFGFVIGLYLIYLHYTSGIIGHFALIMLDILILSIGFQIIIFGLLADMNRK
jgi:glycosyltransferase involved in cell wall biosynthesis